MVKPILVFVGALAGLLIGEKIEEIQENKKKEHENLPPAAPEPEPPPKPVEPPKKESKPVPKEGPQPKDEE